MKQLYAGTLLVFLMLAGICGRAQINADFVGTPALSGCAPLTVSFTDISVPSAGANIVNSTRQWFVNGLPVGGTNSTLNYTFTTPGSYAISLIICDDSPSCDSLTRVGYVTVAAPPVPNLTISPSTGCAPLSVSFTNNSGPACGVLTSTTIYPNHGGPNLSGSGTVTYNSAGNYNVRVRLVNSCGCVTDTTYINRISVDPTPTANFNSPNPTSCNSPHNVTFNNTSSGAGLNYFWDFGDGTTSTATNPSHSYTTGNYTVTLIATNPVTGCADTFVRSNYVNISNVTANFNSANPAGCVGQQICFTNTSTPPGATYSWDFGDGSGTSTAANPCYTYSAPGTYTVSLTVTANGCSDTRTINNYVSINTAPTVDFFTLDDTITCLYPYTVNWQNNSPPGLTYSWTFNGGTPNTANTFNPPPITYGVSGGNARLTVTDGNGCSSILAKPIQIQPVNARFTVDQNRGCAPQRVSFTSTSTGTSTDSIISYSWDFNGDSILDAFTDTGSWVFPDTGCFTPMLVIVTNTGCTDTQWATDLICLGDTPTMSFTYDLDTTCFEEVGIQFNSTSSPGDSCYWDFMDGSPITPGCDLTHVMGEIGTFYPLLTHCHYGCCDTISQGPITINPPQAAFVDSFTCATPLTRYVRSTSTRATHYFWDFGDPNRTDDTANTATATWVYDSSGCYVITLTAYNDTFDCYHSVTRNRCIYDPIAQVTVNDSFICRGQQITFQNISPFSVSGNLLTTRWDFDYQGGAPSYEPSNFLQYKIQNYTYFLPGIYSVVMQNRTPNGCRDTIRKEDWITVHGAYASQSASVTQGCMPLTVTFTDLSYAPLTYIDSIVWDFGDGSPPNSDSIVTHTYTSAGTYNARITVWDSAGCTHSSVQTIVVQHPNVSFNPSDTFICGGQSITFTNTSSGVGLGHQWTFPGVPPVTSTATSPTVTFPDTGVVRVRLVTTDNLGCRDSAFQNIYIRNPVANFGIAAVGLDCPPVFVQFIDSSLNNVVAWQWSYDNNTVSSTLQNPSHTYNRPIVDTISLVITTGSGCTDTVIKPAVSVGGPYISATSEVLDSCIPVRVAYYVQSVRTDTVRAIFPGTGRGAEIFTPGCYGTPSAPCIDTFIITYNQAGSYPIQFVIRDTAGCSRLETLNLPVVNVDTPSAQFNIAFGNICGGGTINLSDASFAGPGGYAITNWDWDFGDGTTSTQQNPNHLYTGPGTFPISLVVTNSIGCTDTSSRPFVVPVDPVARIFTFDTNACVPATIQFYDSTIADTLVAEWDWSFGTMGATSTLQNPTYTYNSVGSFTVSLSVRDSLGCTDTGTFTVTINSIPNVDAGIDTAHCFGDSIQLSASGALTYSWQSNPYLSDTSVSNPFVSVDSLTTFYVTGTDINGCSASDSVIVDMDRVFPFFTFDTVCLGDTTFFTDQSSNLTGSLSSWVWDFDDQGMTSNAQNPFHIFSSDSVYDVTLTVTDNRGCQQDTTISVPISPKPTANFGPDRSCFGDSTLFTDLSQANTGVLVSWAWDFGDGSTDTLRNPVHFYQNPGTYQVCLTVINSSLCAGQDDTCKNIEVTTKPTALFSVDTACLGDDNSFVDQSIDNGGVGLLGWSWDFDTMNPGAQTSIQQNPVNTYIGSGTFPVSLQVTDSAGCSGDTVLPAFVYDIPVASFVGDTVCLGDSICPIDQSSQGTLPILNWSWDMDTSTGIFISGQSPCVLYNTAGQRIVRLAVTDAFGCTDTAFNSVRTVDVVSAAFSTDTVCAGSATQFTDLSTTAFGSVVSWFYDFADGDSAFTANPSHVYQSGGIYPVTLRATTDLGCFHDTTIDVKVYLLPTASFQVDTTCIGDSTFFADASIDNGDGAISGWLWDLDLSNPGANLSVADSPAFIYPALGNYNFSLTVTDVNGCTDDSSGVVTLVGLPTARFTSDSACIQDSICIVDQSIPNAGSLAGWDWQFDINDTGSFLSGQAPCYEYPDSGNYIIRLTVTDRFGCQDDTTNNVVVSSIPRAFFVADSVCLGDTTFFVDQSISDFGSLTDYRWSFGDGDTSILQNPFHVYDSAGVYNVRLTVRNPIGCPHDTIIPVVVYGIPIADFIGDTVCFGDTTFFIDSSTNQPWGNIVGWTWDLDTANIGSSTFNIQNPFTVYPSQGTYWVSLEVVDEHGCVGDTLKPVSLYQLPVARFTPDTVCLGDTICLADSSIPGTGVLNGFAWDMGDGTQLTGSNICHVYSDSGSYQVHLQVSDDRGCTADTTLTNRVQNLPWADFSFLPTCSGDSTRFFDGSLAGQGVLTNWFWDFDDGDTSNLQDPIHIYPNGDTFTVTLTVTNQFGCSDDRSNILPILQGPIPDFLFDTVCFGDSTHFFDNSSNGAGVNAMWIWDFGTGDSSMVQNPVYLFPNDTVFNVRLTVLDTNNCVARVNKDVLVFTLPQAEFTTSNLCFRSAIDFTDQSVPGSNPISTWFWDFDDNGATSTQQNPSHNFSAPANYDLQLVVEDTRGCIDTLDRTLRINPQPVGDFVFSRDIACVGEQVCLTDSSTANGSTGGIGAWAWDFNFNSGIDNTTQNPCTSYNSSGTYTVRLIVTDTNQCRDTIDREIRVFDLPTADFDWSVSCVDSPMVFTDFSLPGDTTITAWFWDFGDNVQDIVQNPSHAYATPGFFNVNLEVTDANGCIDDITKTVSVDFRPDINARQSQTICWGESVILSATGASIYTWEPNIWYQPLIATGDSILATPLNTITYTVTGFNGVCPPDDTTITITVIPTRPMTLEHRGPDSVIANMGTELYADISGLIDSIRWDPDSTLSCNDCRNPVASPSQSTTYRATIYYSLNGVVCTQSDIISVSVIGNCPNDLLFVPSGFSPNGDGNNDILYVRGVGIERVNYFRVFDRWGKLMYEANDVDANDRSIGWDGTTLGGAALNPGVFVYVAEVVCSNGDVLTQTGNVTMIK